MLYFYKETEKALIFTSKVLVKEVEIKGKKVKISQQGSDVKFALLPKREDWENEWPEFKEGEEVTILKCSDAIVTFQDGTEADNMYWATSK